MIMVRDYTPADRDTIQATHDPARQQELCLAGLDGQAVGFVAFSQEELAWLYVRPDCQRRGVGRALAVFALENMASGKKSVEVLAGNEPARVLYRNLGFTKEKLLHRHMPGNEEFEVSAWQMTMA